MVQAPAKQQQLPIEKMDYKGKDIFMLVQSDMDRYRLGACEKEPGTVKWIETLPPDAVLYDIGANVGGYTLVAASRFKGGHVYAFEPAAPTYSTLALNVRLNAMSDRVTALPFALGPAEHIMTLNLPTPFSGGALNTLGVGGTGQYHHPVLVIPLDTAIPRYGLRPPTHMKIDVDGHEPMVMTGAEQAFKGVQQAIIEVNYKVHDGREFILQTMRRWGFVLKEKQVLQSSLEGNVWNVLFERRPA